MTEIKSPVAGSFALIMCHDASTVEKGEQVGQIELMKLFWPIISPANGIIKWRKALGTYIQENEIIAIVE
jgi:biotin carboxyl carrier protein